MVHPQKLLYIQPYAPRQPQEPYSTAIHNKIPDMSLTAIVLRHQQVLMKMGLVMVR